MMTPQKKETPGPKTKGGKRTRRPTPGACKWVAARPRAKQIKQYQAQAKLSHRVDDLTENKQNKTKITS